MTQGTRGRCLLSVAAIIAVVLVFVAVYLPMATRGPASLPPAIPVGLGLQSIPVRIVCAGPATSDGIFQFSSDPGELSVNYDQNGQAIVSGVARVSLRSHGMESDFDGEIKVRGTRSADGRVYNLEADRDGQRLKFELNRDGDGQVTRDIASVGGHVQRKFLSHCQDEL